VFGQPSSSLVNAAILTHADPEAPPESRPNPGYLVRTANHVWQLGRPQDPATLQDEV
jgi:hypothetical protein